MGHFVQAAYLDFAGFSHLSLEVVRIHTPLSKDLTSLNEENLEALSRKKGKWKGLAVNTALPLTPGAARCQESPKVPRGLFTLNVLLSVSGGHLPGQGSKGPGKGRPGQSRPHAFTVDVLPAEAGKPLRDRGTSAHSHPWFVTPSQSLDETTSKPIKYPTI